MGLSSKQVPQDNFFDRVHNLIQADIIRPNIFPMKRQQQQHQQLEKESEALKCPRCDSKNTKFCYYNNYNRTQPRHFCKACKRHWTNGGTLRNVPVGGGRKNKRIKTTNTQMGSQNHQLSLRFSHVLDHDDQKGAKYSSTNNDPFLDSNLSLPLHDLPISSLISSSKSNPSSFSMCFDSSNVYDDYIGGIETLKDSTITIPLPATMNTIMGMPTSYWFGTNWEDFGSFDYSSTDLNIP